MRSTQQWTATAGIIPALSITNAEVSAIAAIALSKINGKWLLEIPFYLGGGVNQLTNGPLADKTGPTSGTFAECSGTTTGGTETALGGNTGGIRTTIDFSKISTPATAYFYIVMMINAGTGLSNLGGELYDYTTDAAITNSPVYQASPVVQTTYKLTSADIAANLPTTSKEMGFKVVITGTTPGTIAVGRAELLMYI